MVHLTTLSVASNEGENNGLSLVTFTEFDRKPERAYDSRSPFRELNPGPIRMRNRSANQPLRCDV